MIEPVAKASPIADRSAYARLVGTVFDDAPKIYAFEDVLNDVLEYFESDQARELGGFLVGGLHEDREMYVEVRGFLPATGIESGAVSLTFTHRTWATMTRQVEDRFPDELLLGWAHTHPGLGIFLSSYDLFIHRHFFTQPWHIALVVDPRRRQLGFFQWHRGQVVNCGFICVRRAVR